MKHLLRFIAALFLSVGGAQAQWTYNGTQMPNGLGATSTMGLNPSNQFVPLKVDVSGNLLTSGGGGGGGGSILPTNPQSFRLSDGTNWQQAAQDRTTAAAPFAFRLTLDGANFASTVPVSSTKDTVGPFTAQTTGNNLLTTDGSWLDAAGYNSFSAQIIASAGISAGAIIFEQTNDITNAPSGVPLAVDEQGVINANPFTAAITIAANTNRMFKGAITGRFIRVRISTTFVGGTVRATSAFSTLPYAGVALNVQQATAASLNVTASVSSISTSVTPGTAAANLGKAEDAVAASGDTGVAVLGVRRDALTTSASAAADYGEVTTNRFGAPYVSDFRLSARTYKAITAAFVPAASATDIWDIFGNVTTTVVVTRLRVTATQTTAGTVNLTALSRSTANSAGTRVVSTATRLEQADTAASSVPGHYTANPTTGTLFGNVAGGIALVGSTTTGPGVWEFNFGDKGKGVVLSGTAQGLAINLGAVTVTGGSFVVEAEYYEF
jgi:hypothetical protein